VVDAAARVGGIAGQRDPASRVISDNHRTQINLLDTAVTSGAQRFLFLASSCIYPKYAEQPTREEALFTGPAESTNESFAVAELAGIGQLVAIRRQHSLPYICAMPANVYGEGDNFDRHDSHVLPAMIRRFHEAVCDGATR
jgi:GDP-L-fucose synthase